jgi:ketosteroid isomerase-like protein
MDGADGSELVSRMEALFKAVAAKDLRAIEACYLNEPALLVFLEGPRSRNIGWENIRVGWRHFIDAPMRLKKYEWGEDRLVRVRGDAGFVAATNRFTWEMGGKDLVVEMRATWAMERVGGTWRIVHEHASLPHPDPYGTGDWNKP